MPQPAAVVLLLLAMSLASATTQDMPAAHAAVLSALGRIGDFKGGVLEVDIPRNDLTISVDGALTS